MFFEVMTRKRDLFADLFGSGEDKIHEELQGDESQQDYNDRRVEYRQD